MIYKNPWFKFFMDKRNQIYTLIIDAVLSIILFKLFSKSEYERIMIVTVVLLPVLILFIFFCFNFTFKKYIIHEDEVGINEDMKIVLFEGTYLVTNLELNILEKRFRSRQIYKDKDSNAFFYEYDFEFLPKNPEPIRFYIEYLRQLNEEKIGCVLFSNFKNNFLRIQVHNQSASEDVSRFFKRGTENQIRDFWEEFNDVFMTEHINVIVHKITLDHYDIREENKQ